MDSVRKLRFWKLLLKCGFKEIEGHLIPEDVTIQVLTQARTDLIEQTFAALEGAHNATVHLYNATAPLFRQLVFRQSKEEIVQLAVSTTQKIRALCEASPQTRWNYEYSPETFCFTEPDFALQICEAVADVWEPSPERPMILNLPATVEVNTPNVYADQIEYFCRHFSRRNAVCISVHPHNDRGCGVASAELALPRRGVSVW